MEPWRARGDDVRFRTPFANVPDFLLAHPRHVKHVLDDRHVRDGQMDDCWLEVDAFGGVQHMAAIPPKGVSTLGRIAFTLASFVRFARLEVRYKRSQKAAR